VRFKSPIDLENICLAGPRVTKRGRTEIRIGRKKLFGG